MNNLTTLTSLAMLKVNADAERRDYMEYLKPFVLFVLSQNHAAEISDSAIADSICEEFGLRIPDRAINLVLRRLAKKRTLEKKFGAFYGTSKIERPNLEVPRADARSHIERISESLFQFSKKTAAPLSDEAEALEVLVSFLSEFSIDCLKTYVFHTALPRIPKKRNRSIVLVSKFVRRIHKENSSRWDSFMVLAKGHMLANALMCPDLESLKSVFRKTTFYLDTPFVMRLLGLEGQERQRAAEQTVELTRSQGGKFAVFEHTMTESYNVISGAARFIDSPEGRGRIVFEMRKQRKKFSDLVLIAEKLDILLSEKGVNVKDTPRYEIDLQIDEISFHNILDEEISYYNEKAKEFDVNSVRSIYVLRQGTFPRRLEDARAVLVTSNEAFAKAAFQFGKEFESTKEVSSVITDFSLANIAWLKSPMKAVDLPQKEILSLSYAALNPSERLWNQYVKEIEALEDSQDIQPRDHALLKYGLNVREELMNLTLGEEEALTKQTVTQILQKAINEYSGEINQELATEKVAHDETKDALQRQIAERAKIEKRIFATANWVSGVAATMASLCCAALVVIGTFGTLFRIHFIVPVLVLVGVGALTCANLILGMTVKRIYSAMRGRIHSFVVSRLQGRAN